MQVYNGGAIDALLVDTAGRYLNSSYAKRVSHHEAGHFLVAYLIGLLPKRYTLSAADALSRYDTVAIDDICCREAWARLYTW